MAAPDDLAAAGGRPSRSGCQWRQPEHSTYLLWPRVEAAMAAHCQLAVTQGLPSALAASGGSQSTLLTCSGREWRRQWRPTDIWPPLEAGPHALAASGGSQSTLLTCSGREWRRQWRLTDIWPPLEAGPHALAASGGSQSTLPTCSGRRRRRQRQASNLTSGRRWRPALTLWLPVEAARALYLPALAAAAEDKDRRPT